MKEIYISPAIETLKIVTEQCILSESNTPGLEPGTDLDELFY